MRPALIIRPQVILLLLLLSGCSGGGADAPFETYLSRLQRTLEVAPATDILEAPVPRLPRTGQLRLAIAGDSLGTLDFLDLHGCDLQVTIGRQNSSLGRMAADSQRLLLALEYLRLAPACVEHLQAQGNVNLAATLEDARLLKQRQLPSLIFNATLANEEFRAFWRPVSPNAEYPTQTSSAVITALEGIDAAARRWLAGDYRADNLAFELQLSEVNRGDGGQLWRALAHQAHWLERGNQLVKQREARGPLCRDRLRPAAADILPNVIRKFFIDGIQPRAAALGGRYHQLLPPALALEAQLQAVLPPAYLQWQHQRDSELARLSNAPREHVSQLQGLLESCQETP